MNAEQYLLDDNGLNEAQLTRVFAHLAEHRIDDADLYFQHTQHEAWNLEDGRVKSGRFSIDQGVGVRAISGEKTAFAYSDDLSFDRLWDAAGAVRMISQAGQSKSVAIGRSVSCSALYPAENPAHSLDTEKKLALLETIERMAKARDSRIIQVMASLACVHEYIYVARLDGIRAQDIRPLVRVSISVIAEQGERREVGSSGGGGRYLLSDLQEQQIESYVNQAVDQALVNLEAQPAPAGQMTVVLGSGWPGVLLHEAVGHGLEGDFNRKGSSAFAGKMGQRVAAPGVTVVDDGSLSGLRGSLSIDDEGCVTQRNVLIENGILKAYLQDSLNARLMSVPPTGNGRRESYAHLPMPRMTNTFMLDGQDTPEDIIASVEDGLYAINFGGGQVDITNGKFVFSASEAWRIEKGQLTYPVKGATLIGSGPDVLHYVSMIGNDMQLDQGIGVCGKDGQSVPVGVGQPTLRIDGGLTVGGTHT